VRRAPQAVGKAPGQRSLRARLSRGLRGMAHAPRWEQRPGIGWVCVCLSCPQRWAWGADVYPANVDATLRYARRCAGRR